MANQVNLDELIARNTQEGARLKATSPTDVVGAYTQANQQTIRSNNVAQGALAEQSATIKETAEARKTLLQEAEEARLKLDSYKQERQEQLTQANSGIQTVYQQNRREISEGIQKLNKLEEETPGFFENPVRNLVGRVQTHFARKDLDKDMNDLAEAEYAMRVNRQATQQDILDYTRSTYMATAAALNSRARLIANEQDAETAQASLAVNAADRNADTAQKIAVFTQNAANAAGYTDEDLDNPVLQYVAGQSSGDFTSFTPAQIKLAKEQYRNMSQEQRAAVAQGATNYLNLRQSGAQITTEKLLGTLIDTGSVADVMSNITPLNNQRLETSMQRAYSFGAQQRLREAEQQWRQQNKIAPDAVLAPEQETALEAVQQATLQDLQALPAKDVMTPYFENEYQQSYQDLVPKDGNDFTASGLLGNKPALFETIVATGINVKPEEVVAVLESEEAKIGLDNPALNTRIGMQEKLLGLTDLLATNLKIERTTAAELATSLARNYYQGKMFTEAPELENAVELGILKLPTLQPRSEVTIRPEAPPSALAFGAQGTQARGEKRGTPAVKTELNVFDPVDLLNFEARLARENKGQQR